MVTLPGDPQQVAAVPWDYLGCGSADRAWSLRLATPTTFRRGNRFTPLPAPSPILGSLRRSWSTWAPPTEAITLDLAHDPVWVSDIDGRNEVVKVSDRTVSGFVGRIRFECDAGDHVARAVHRLVALAPFAGVGAHTTRGFGVVRLEPTWQPRCRP
jgi:CRISPR-associated endoribonuclease Cas6